MVATPPPQIPTVCATPHQSALRLEGHLQGAVPRGLVCAALLVGSVGGQPLLTIHILEVQIATPLPAHFLCVNLRQISVS